MKPTKKSICKFALTYAQCHENIYRISFEEAEKMLDNMFEIYNGISSQYVVNSNGRKELIVATVSRKSILCRIQIDERVEKDGESKKD